MFVGILLILIGALMLLHEVGIIEGNVWDFIWPAVLVALGLHLILRAKRPGPLNQGKTDGQING